MWAPIWPGVAEAERPVPRDHQRRPRADLDCRRAGDAVRRRTSAPTGASATTIRRCGTRVLDIPDEELWAARQALRALPVHLHPRARARSAGREERVGAARVVAAGTLLDPERADDRLRAALHRLQAARADLPRPRAARADPQRRRPAGADRLRRQGASGRRRPASTTCSRSTAARSIRRSAAASRSSTTTTCTSRTSSCRAATSG